MLDRAVPGWRGQAHKALKWAWQKVVVPIRCCTPLQAADADLRAARSEAEMYEARAGRAIQQVTAIRQAVEDMFVAAGCDTPAVRELLGAGGVTAGNLMQYLGIVEQEADQLLQVWL